MAGVETVTVKIKKWTDHNGRHDVKRPSWFRLEWALVEDSDFYGFSHEEFKAWIYVLSMACKKNCETIRLNYAHAEGVARLSRKGVDGALGKLESLGIVTVERNEHVADAVRARHADVTDAFATRQDKTEQDKTEQDKTAPSASVPDLVFDFEEIYRRYPLKKGKAAGIKSCIAQIHSSEDCDALSRAVDAYTADVVKNQTPARFQKHFSTFMGTERTGYPWRDWAEPGAGTSLVVGVSGRAEDRSRSNAAVLDEYTKRLKDAGDKS